MIVKFILFCVMKWCYLKNEQDKKSPRSGWRLTKRAADFWEPVASSSIFLASSFSCSHAFSQPAHTQVTPTVGLP
jgi:hypothetical protein